MAELVRPVRLEPVGAGLLGEHLLHEREGGGTCVLSCLNFSGLHPGDTALILLLIQEQ